ncbi:MAG TPA: hypothetical protein DCL21_02595 [Alphaproteobacteria bacterium]|nr:hypothetical protein [Alphaproteobacteria bacterium]
MSYDFSDVVKSVAYRYALLKDIGIFAVFLAVLVFCIFLVWESNGIPVTYMIKLSFAGTGISGVISIIIGKLGFMAYE